MVGLDNDPLTSDAAIYPVIDRSIFVMVPAVLNRPFGQYNSALTLYRPSRCFASQAGPLMPVSAKVAIAPWHSAAARNTPSAKVAPDPSPKRMPKSKSGDLPIRSRSLP